MREIKSHEATAVSGGADFIGQQPTAGFGATSGGALGAIVAAIVGAIGTISDSGSGSRMLSDITAP